MPSGSSLHGFCPKTRKGGPQADDSLRGRWCQRPSVPFLRGMEVTAHPHVLVRGMRTQSWPGRWAGHLLSWEIQVRYIHTRPQGLLAPLPHHPLLKVSVDRQRRDPNTEGGHWQKPNTESRRPSSQGGGAAHVSRGPKAHGHAVGPASDQPIHSPSSSGHLLRAREDLLQLQCRSVPLPAMSGGGRGVRQV